MEPIKIMLVDNEEIFLEGLAKVLRRKFQNGVIHCARSVMQIPEEDTNGGSPNVVILGKDVTPGNVYDRIRMTQELLPKSKLAVILPPDAEEDPVEILKSGALACLSRNIDADDFLACTQLILAGRIIVSYHFTARFLKSLSRRKEEVQEKEILSGREIEITKLVAQGKTNREISQSLFVTENTVKVHVRNILNKMKYRNRQQLVALAIMKKWMTQVAAIVLLANLFLFWDLLNIADLLVSA